MSPDMQSGGPHYHSLHLTFEFLGTTFGLCKVLKVQICDFAGF